MPWPGGRCLYSLVSSIEAYVEELDGALRGPRTVKADMLAEALDGLRDAAEAFRGTGIDAAGAERRAVAEFGPVAEIAPLYQAQLVLSVGRRTAMLVCLLLASQPIIWRVLLPLAGIHTAIDDPAYRVTNNLVQWSGGASIAVGLTIILALGVGTRYVGIRPSLTRLTGVFGLVVCGLFAVLGTVLTLLKTGTGAALDWTGLPTTMVLLGVPLLVIGLKARACLVAAR
jgi:hypothetical protein